MWINEPTHAGNWWYYGDDLNVGDVSKYRVRGIIKLEQNETGDGTMELQAGDIPASMYQGVWRECIVPPLPCENETYEVYVTCGSLEQAMDAEKEFHSHGYGGAEIRTTAPLPHECDDFSDVVCIMAERRGYAGLILNELHSAVSDVLQTTHQRSAVVSDCHHESLADVVRGITAKLVHQNALEYKGDVTLICGCTFHVEIVQTERANKNNTTP